MILLFLLVAGISFAGSLHPGTVNLAVLETTLHQNRRAGLWLALGGSLPEFGYSALAAGGLMALSATSPWTQWLGYAALPVLLGASWAAFRQKTVRLKTGSDGKIAAGALFWKGITLAATNPQLLPFWSAVWLYLNQSTPVSTGAGPWVFALGSSAGAFALLLVLVWLADLHRTRIDRYLSGQWLNYLTGGLFAGMALWQAIRLVRPA